MVYKIQYIGSVVALFKKGLLLYRILLFSVKPQQSSWVYIYISLWKLPPFPHPTSRLADEPIQFSWYSNSHWLSFI